MIASSYICIILDTFVNNRVIGRYQHAVDSKNNFINQKELFNEKQSINNPKVAEVMILLDLLEQVNYKVLTS